MKSLTTLSTLFYFTTIRMTSLTSLTTLFYFTTFKIKSLTALITPFNFTTLKMKPLTTVTTLFYLTTIKIKSLTTLTTLSYFTTIKSAFSSLRQFLATKSPLRMMKNAFYFTSKALSFFKIFKFLYWLFGHAAKQLDKKDKVNFKLYDVTAWLTNNRTTHIAQFVEK